MRFRHERCSVLVFIAIISLLAVTLLTSCTSLQLSKKAGQDTTTAPLVHTGLKGIDMSFLQGYPPDRFYFDPTTYNQGRNNLAFSVEVRNLGTSDASGSLYLSGFDNSILVMDTTTKTIDSTELTPKAITNPEGGVKIETFNVNSIDMPEGTETYSPKVVLTACYDYTTVATPAICVDPDPYAPASDKVCVPSIVAISAGQGAPVSVSNVVVEPVPGKLQLRIDISNVGGGTVISSSSLDSCPYNLVYSDLNVIDSASVFVQGIGSQMTCNPSAIRLTNNKASIYCSAPITANAAYTTPLRVELKYGYMNSITKQLEIRNIKS